MRSGIVAGTSALLATLASALLLAAFGLRSPPVQLSTLLPHWGTAAVVWLGVYTLAVVIITASSTVREIGIASGRLTHGWTQRYFLGLTVAQYFTGILALMGLSLVRAPAEFSSLLPLGIVGRISALEVAGLMSALGVVGACVVTIIARPKRRFRANADPSELQLLHEILDLLRNRTARSRTMVLDGPTEDPAEAIKRIEQGQRATLEVMQSLGVVVDRLQRSLAELPLALPKPGVNGSAPPELLSRPDLEQATGELRSAVEILGACATRFQELLALLARSSLTAIEGAGSIDARAQVSTELRELLREMNRARATARRSDPSGATKPRSTRAAASGRKESGG